MPHSKSKLWIVAAGLVTLNLIGLAYLWFYRGTAALDSGPAAPGALIKSLDTELAALRSTGMPAEARDVNAFYVVPAGVADTTELWVNAIKVVELAKIGARGRTLPIIGSGTSPIPLPGQPWIELEASRALLGECATELQAVRKAAAAGGQGRFPVDFSAGSSTPLPHAQEARQVARLLDLDAWVSAHDGKGAQALEDVRAIFALSEALRGEPLFISQLVRIAVYAVACDTAARLMPHCSWNESDLTSLQSAVQSARFKDEMARACCGERAMCVTELDSTLSGSLPPENARAMLRLFEQAIDSYSDSWPEVLARQQELTAEANRLKGLSEALPSMEQAAIAGARATARQRCLAAAIAVERYRLQNNQWPQSLSEVKGLFAPGPGATTENLIDPFDGKPLRYKVEEKRFVIYSVGINQADDGGDVFDHAQPAPQQGLDIGVSIKR